MADFNLSVILDAVRRAPKGLSRVQLAGLVGLAPQTVSNICRRLLDQELIIEAGKEAAGPGKPRTILRLNPQGMYAVGVHLDPSLTTYALLDLAGNQIRRRQHPTDTVAGPDQVIADMGAQILELVRDSGIETARIAGVGVATPGPIDSYQGAVVDPPDLPGWGRVLLRNRLAEATGLPVLLDKDVTAAAVAEIWKGGASGTGSFVFFYLGTGIGCGMVLNGEVVRGSSGNAGEIGHIVADPDGRVCDCGKRGCIRVTCMPSTLVAEARELGVLADDGGAQERRGADDGGAQVGGRGPASSGADNRPAAGELPEQMAALSEAAASGDEAARGILERSAARVGCAVAVVTNLLDVERVVFGGPFWGYLKEYYLDRVPALIRERSVTSGVHSVEVVGTGAGDDVGAVGAACLVLEHRLGPHAAKLLLAD
jgi:predicted NBD/HSP70 family sugar kinase